MGKHQVQAARFRALTALGACVLGVVLASRFPSAAPVAWFSAACLLAAGTIALGGPRRGAGLGLCLVALSAGWTLTRTSGNGTHRLNAVVGAINAKLGRVPIEIEGVVAAPVRVERRMAGLADPPMWPEERWEGLVRVRRVYATDGDGRGSWVRASGEARLLVPEGVELAAGASVRVLGMYAPPPGARNAGEPHWRAMSAQSGRVGSIVVNDASQIEPGAPGGLGDRIAAGAARLRWVIRARALSAIGLDGAPGSETSEGGAMMGALLLGQRDPGFEGVYERFQRIGAAHVLAISGFHLALVVLLSVVVIRAIGEHPRIETLIVAGVLGLIVLVIPMQPPIVRAAAIVGALILSGAAGRRYDRMTVLAWVGVALIIWRPLDALGLDYQLSMGVTALLVVLGDRDRRAMLNRRKMPVAEPLDKARGFPGRAWRWVVESARMNFACWLVATPAIVYHAGLVSLLAPVVALVLIPMVMVLMVVGYVQVVVGVIAPSLGGAGMGAVGAMARVVMGFVAWADSIPGAWARVDRVSAAWAIAATVLAALLVTRRVRWRSPFVLGACAAAVGWVFIEPMVWRESAPVRIDMLDVGDGSCLLIQSQGRGLVWDCGSLDRRVGRTAARAARSLRITRLRDAVVTHDNLDHFNALPELARLAGIERVWISDRLWDSPSHAWSRVAAALEAMGVEIHRIAAGDTLVIGRARLDILWPDPARIARLDDNDTSVVARLTIGGDDDQTPSVLLCGDIEAPAMDAIEALYPGLGAEVLELPHHGSARDRAYGFVRELDPALVLQSTGPTRLDDDRWDAVRAGRDWYATAGGGGVWVTLDEAGITGRGWEVDRD